MKSIRGRVEMRKIETLENTGVGKKRNQCKKTIGRGRGRTSKRRRLSEQEGSFSGEGVKGPASGVWGS